MVVVRWRVAWLSRKYLRATLLLGLAAGLASGLALVAWQSSRQAAVALGHFEVLADPPELTMTFCPPDMTTLAADEILRCFAHKPTDELARLRSLPQVRSADRFAYQFADGGPAGRPDEMRRITFVAAGDPGVVTPGGRPVVLQGRLADPEALDETVINEAAVRTTGLGLGDRLDMRWLVPGEFERDAPATGPQLTLEIVGIVRTGADLSAFDGSDVAALLLTGPAVWRAVEDEAWLGFTAIAIQAADADAARAAIQAAFPGRVFNIEPGTSADDDQPIRDAFAYEAKAALAFAVLTGLAALIFVGQAIARQVRREWTDLPVLRALGWSQHEVGRTAVGRGAIIGVLGGMIAGVVAIVGSRWTPVGAARSAVVVRGVQVDGVVLGIGLPLVVLLAAASAWLPVRRLTRLHRRPLGHSPSLVVPGGGLPPPGRAGIGMAVNGGRGGTGLPIGTAVIGVTLAVAALVAALVVRASLHGLVTTPARYGARWDVSLKTLDPAGMGDVGEHVVALPGVGAASILLGEGLAIDGETTWTIALDPLKGTSIAPVVSEGRAPVSADEIALGALTQQDLGKGLGDTVTLSTNLSTSKPRRLLIVGTAVMNAIDEGSPGLGAVVTSDLMHDVVPYEAGDAIVVDLAENADGEAARVAIERDLAVDGNEFDPPRRQNAVRNVERIRSLPYLLAAVVALFAVASLAHALVLSVRRNRPQLAVLKALGFTRPQVSAAVAWEASALALASVAIGAPIGLLLARLGWGEVADRLGLASPTVVPVTLVLLVALATLTFANLVALGPGWRAARIRPAEALRAE
jgi:ABC-type lipoprotein release transport system permease subunit